MIEILRVKVQYLNGDNVIKNYKLPSIKVFTCKEALEDYRKLRQLKLQYKAGKDIKVSVLFDTKEL